MITGTWHNVAARKTDITVIDFETTGSVRGWSVEPWQMGLVTLRNGRVDPGSLARHWLRIDPERPFNPHAPGRHQQLRHTLAAAPAFVEVWAAVAPVRLHNRPLAAHNIGTERTMLRRVAPLHHHGPWIDTLSLARHAWPDLRNHSLKSIIASLGLLPRVRELAPQSGAHDAGYDACACAALLEYLLALPSWRDITVAALAHIRGGGK